MPTPRPILPFASMPLLIGEMVESVLPEAIDDEPTEEVSGEVVVGSGIEVVGFGVEVVGSGVVAASAGVGGVGSIGAAGSGIDAAGSDVEVVASVGDGIEDLVRLPRPSFVVETVDGRLKDGASVGSVDPVSDGLRYSEYNDKSSCLGTVP